eukprot:TRINITY_DN121086_c0_g1_i1.p2 TRINITY_DN121086_c0_g1~~TRINITY_DN121086_c0_g1_i1.p2  ORF type:complete len:244 (+),score=54.03 TRINITY_DN121086_c0_g1_i1:104-835(+)
MDLLRGAAEVQQTADELEEVVAVGEEAKPQALALAGLQELPEEEAAAKARNDKDKGKPDSSNGTKPATTPSTSKAAKDQSVFVKMLNPRLTKFNRPFLLAVLIVVCTFPVSLLIFLIEASKETCTSLTYATPPAEQTFEEHQYTGDFQDHFIFVQKLRFGGDGCVRQDGQTTSSIGSPGVPHVMKMAASRPDVQGTNLRGEEVFDKKCSYDGGRWRKEASTLLRRPSSRQRRAARCSLSRTFR